MSIIDQEERVSKLKKMDNSISKELRSLVKGGTKNLKTQWITVAQTLHSIWRDKLYEYWGHEKFETYTQSELGIKKPLALKMIKVYMFLENNEPHAVKPEFAVLREPALIPDLDAINVLRLTKMRDRISREDYAYLRRLVFDKAVSAADLRREAKRILSEKEEITAEEAQEALKKDIVRKLKGILGNFKGKAKAFNWCRAEIIQKAEDLLGELNDAI